MKIKTVLKALCACFKENPSIYGIKAILYTFLRNEYQFGYRQAILTLHIFLIATYNSISNRVYGDVKSSLICLVGLLLLSVSSILRCSYVLFISLSLVALGYRRSYKSQKKIIHFVMFMSIWVPFIADLSCFNRSNCFPISFTGSSLLHLLSIFAFIGDRAATKELIKNQSCANLDRLTAINFVASSFLINQQYSQWIEQGQHLEKLKFSKFTVISTEIVTIIIGFIVPLISSLYLSEIKLRNYYTAYVLIALSYIAAALVEFHNLNVIWQIPQFLLISIADSLIFYKLKVKLSNISAEKQESSLYYEKTLFGISNILIVSVLFAVNSYLIPMQIYYYSMGVFAIYMSVYNYKKN